MVRRVVKLFVVAIVPVFVWWTLIVRGRAEFPRDTTPEGAYARIVLAVTEGHPRDCFAYLETKAQWACYTIHDYRSKAAERIVKAYPEPEKSAALAALPRESNAADGADVWLAMAESRGFLPVLRRDLSGAKDVDVAGERATIETARGTRYAFRRRENGIWGLTLFTAELLSESEKAARDYDMVRRAADDYERAKGAPSPPSSAAAVP